MTYEVFPQSDGSWSWKLDSEGRSEYVDRASAIQGALEHRADEGRSEAVVLCRADGSVHGEVAHALSGDDNDPWYLDIEPAGEYSDAI